MYVYELQLLGKMLGQGGVRGLRSQVIPQLTGLGQIEVSGQLKLQLCIYTLHSALSVPNYKTFVIYFLISEKNEIQF